MQKNTAAKIPRLREYGFGIQICYLSETEYSRSVLEVKIQAKAVKNSHLDKASMFLNEDINLCRNAL